MKKRLLDFLESDEFPGMFVWGFIGPITLILCVVAAVFFGTTGFFGAMVLIGVILQLFTRLIRLYFSKRAVTKKKLASKEQQ